LIRNVTGLTSLGDNLQVMQALTDGHLDLMSVDNPDERAAPALPFCTLMKEIPVMSENTPT
jgi:hypothetical protein